MCTCVFKQALRPIGYPHCFVFSYRFECHFRVAEAFPILLGLVPSSYGLFSRDSWFSSRTEWRDRPSTTPAWWSRREQTRTSASRRVTSAKAASALRTGTPESSWETVLTWYVWCDSHFQARSISLRGPFIPIWSFSFCNVCVLSKLFPFSPYLRPCRTVRRRCCVVCYTGNRSTTTWRR